MLCLTQITKPKVRDIVEVKCSKCDVKTNIVFRDLIKSVNKHLAIGLDGYHCPCCLRSSSEFIEKAHDKSVKALDKITAGASDRSKKLWRDETYRQKMAINSKNLSSDPEFKSKVSIAIKERFATDVEYVTKVNAARYNDAAKFFEKCSEIHNNLYDYSSATYLGVEKPISIFCALHGGFSQLPSNHIKGHGCPQCANEASKLSQSDFFARCVIKHDNFYDYSKTEYTGSLSYIEYRCQKHGLIKQLAQNHLKGAGCRFCDAEKTASKAELEIAKYISQFTEISCNDRRFGVEFDILAESKKLAVEYHGLYWHSYNHQETKVQRYSHHFKADVAAAAGYNLIQIYESEWLQRRAIVESMLLSKLGCCNNKIGARSCSLVSLSSNDADEFFYYNHLAGVRKAAANFALVYRDDILAAVSFNRKGDGVELIRFANKLNWTVAGGLSKLLCYGLKQIPATIISTFADRRYSSTAAAYRAVGFTYLGITAPGYCYCRGLKLYSRLCFQKHKLVDKLLTFDLKLTEAQNMFMNGYRRIWDAGHHKLTWSKNENS